MTPETSAPPPEIAELVEACRQYVQRAVQLDLDLTPETLPVLDHYIGLVRGSTEDRPELVSLVTRAVGAYFGELARRHIGGIWHVPDQDVHHWVVCATPVYLSFNPIAAACEALALGSDRDGPSAELRLAPEDRAVVEARLAQLPPVADDEYYLLSTRLEVLEIVAEALRGQMIAGGQEDVTFELADYDADLPH